MCTLSVISVKVMVDDNLCQEIYFNIIFTFLSQVPKWLNFSD